MTEDRMKELLRNCIKLISYDNDSTAEHLIDIVGFTPRELDELGYGYIGEEREDTDAE